MKITILIILQSYPPPQLLPVILKLKDAYKLWLFIHKNFPKVERLGIGQKIEDSLLNILELNFALSYLPPEQKIILLSKAISKLDILKFFMQLAWENKLVPTEKYSDISKRLEEIGRQFGGWKKGLQMKTSAGK